MLRDMIHITFEYLSHKEKVVVVGSKAEALEVKSAKLRKDIIFAMEKAYSAKKRAKVLANELKVEKHLTV